MRVAIIVPYFGHFPDYYQLFLDSCGYNPEFDWIIFSDDTSEYRYPDNVHFVAITWDSLKEKIQSCFDFKISLSKPQKLCDYKCAYGLIFKDMLTDYDWWGHCDLDQIFGDLSAFITYDLLKCHDKIGSLGHFTLYRNTLDNNLIFMNSFRYREVFSTEQGCGFDEWLPGNINELYQISGCPVVWKNFGADINSYRTTLQVVEYDMANHTYIMSPVKNSIFNWDNGRLMQVWSEKGRVYQKEYPYVHLQKRSMKDCRSHQSSLRYWIIPNRFVDDAEPISLLKKAANRGRINDQYVKVKWKSFCYRLKSGNWKFDNVFRK